MVVVFGESPNIRHAVDGAAAAQNFAPGKFTAVTVTVKILRFCSIVPVQLAPKQQTVEGRYLGHIWLLASSFQQQNPPRTLLRQSAKF